MFNNNMTTKPNILLLGGITEAYELADKLSQLPLNVITSLAGRTKQPRQPNGALRIGGFGGVDGLIHYCLTQKIDFIIDATHPFAFEMTKNALEASQITNIPLIRFERAVWKKHQDDKWIEVETLEQAAQQLTPYHTVFLALGRQHLDTFLKIDQCNFIARMIEPPIKTANNIKLIFSKPGTIEDEKSFLINHQIDAIICRNSGGVRSYTKIEAARVLKLPVIMISRKSLPNLMITDNQDDLIQKLCIVFNL